MVGRGQQPQGTITPREVAVMWALNTQCHTMASVTCSISVDKHCRLTWSVHSNYLASTGTLHSIILTTVSLSVDSYSLLGP